MNISAIQNYFNNFRGIRLNQEILHHLKIQKEQEVLQNNQVAAKEIWCLEQVFKIIDEYLLAFNNLRDKKHFDAWCAFERAEIGISSLKKHLNFDDNKYNLEFYDRVIYQYQKLFPYEYFFSRESVIKKSSCSICGQTMSLRNPCGHKVGEIYNGEQCLRKIEDMKLLAIAVVKNPFDKYAVLFPQDMEYNYAILDNLMDQISRPYDDWRLEVVKEKRKEYIGVGRNKLCPCNSGRKYKFCCLDTDSELFDHYRIFFHTDSPKKNIPMQLIHTWK